MANYYMDSGETKFSYTGMDDGGYSTNLINTLNSNIKAKRITGDLTKYANANKNGDPRDVNLYDSLFHANNLRRRRHEVYSRSRNGGDIFTETFRFGLSNIWGAITNAREFIFFTKPDLHLYKSGITNASNGGKDYSTSTSKKKDYSKANEGLGSLFWQDLFNNKDRIIQSLQFSHCTDNDPFNHLLQNTCVSNLDIPSLNAPSVETSTNTFGVNLTYRGSSEESDDGPEFSLEFRDDRYLNVYTYFRAYEEYETLKKHGTIQPQKYYIINKILHDQFSIYKFIVGEDMETILYWGKYYGVYPTSLPRDAFSNANFQDGLSLTINFKAAFYEDMRPEILYDFNSVGKELADKCKYRIDIYNDQLHRADGRAAKVAQVVRVEGKDERAYRSQDLFYYKLIWKGDEVV